ncbi:hypothetical protein MSG28_008945 [Choristoneura fumiferana]|uniref:Uncharacterized protein n=1 Tax=Choristoneura fumiferana TaxID=7141 RepID=A0ACC0J8K5_CHOFU|nr:hypothetical protein MSG28_008945 [Choristoneura fumiferana]
MKVVFVATLKRRNTTPSGQKSERKNICWCLAVPSSNDSRHWSVTPERRRGAHAWRYELRVSHRRKYSNNLRESRPSKRNHSGFPVIASDQQISQWLEELNDEGDFSDVDDSVEDPDFVADAVEVAEPDSGPTIQEVSDGSTTSGNESSDYEDNLPLSLRANSARGRGVTNYIGKNGYLWSKTEFARTSRTPAHNIVHVSRPTEPPAFQNFYEIWSKIFDLEMVNRLVIYTNKKLRSYREQFRNSGRGELKDTNETEILSLLGLLYYSAVFKCNNADANYLFATDGTGHEIFRCVMSKYRFCTLLNCLRLDDGADRQERLKTDPLAAVSWFFNKFVKNSQQNFTPGPNTCIDEMLIPFKGRCKFIIYMPKKPAKYGIKVVILCDSETFYAYNAYIYSGKNSDGEGLSEAERNLAIPTQSVLRLVKPIEKSNRNVTADNWFSSIQPNKSRELGSSLYGFTKDFTLLSYVPKKNKAVILISSSHHVKSSDEITNKPTMIMDYNHTKGGVDEIDKKCSVYSSSRKTRRWPMTIFYRILDLAGTNAYVLYKGCLGTKLRRGEFLKSLARELVLPSLQQRVYNDRLPRELRLRIKRVFGNDLPLPPPQPAPGPSDRKICTICPARLKRKTRFACCACNRAVCLQCSEHEHANRRLPQHAHYAPPLCSHDCPVLYCPVGQSCEQSREITFNMSGAVMLSSIIVDVIIGGFRSGLTCLTLRIKGHHGLACTKSAGRLSCHACLTDIFRRALASINVPSTFEPVGLARDDSKRPVGMTLVPWQMGRPIILDATCVDTLAPSHLAMTSLKAGAAAATAETAQCRKYENLANNFIFAAFAVERLYTGVLDILAVASARRVATTALYVESNNDRNESKHDISAMVLSRVYLLVFWISWLQHQAENSIILRSYIAYEPLPTEATRGLWGRPMSNNGRPVADVMMMMIL